MFCLTHIDENLLSKAFSYNILLSPSILAPTLPRSSLPSYLTQFHDFSPPLISKAKNQDNQTNKTQQDKNYQKKTNNTNINWNLLCVGQQFPNTRPNKQCV